MRGAELNVREWPHFDEDRRLWEYTHKTLFYTFFYGFCLVLDLGGIMVFLLHFYDQLFNTWITIAFISDPSTTSPTSTVSQVVLLDLKQCLTLALGQRECTVLHSHVQNNIGILDVECYCPFVLVFFSLMHFLLPYYIWHLSYKLWP